MGEGGIFDPACPEKAKAAKVKLYEMLMRMLNYINLSRRLFQLLPLQLKLLVTTTTPNCDYNYLQLLLLTTATTTTCGFY